MGNWELLSHYVLAIIVAYVKSVFLYYGISVCNEIWKFQNYIQTVFDIDSGVL